MCFLQSFLRDAEQLESVTASDEAFLDFDDLGVSFCVSFSVIDLIGVRPVGFNHLLLPCELIHGYKPV